MGRISHPFFMGPSEDGFTEPPAAGRPVLWWDTRDWTGGIQPMPTGPGDPGEDKDTLYDVGVIPNQGTAGSNYDLQVRMRHWTETPVDEWIFTARVENTQFVSNYQVPVSPTAAAFYAAIGGSPAEAPMCMVFAFGLSDGIAGTVDGRTTSDSRQWLLDNGTLQPFSGSDPPFVNHWMAVNRNPTTSPGQANWTVNVYHDADDDGFSFQLNDTNYTVPQEETNTTINRYSNKLGAIFFDTMSGVCEYWFDGRHVRPPSGTVREMLYKRDEVDTMWRSWDPYFRLGSPSSWSQFETPFARGTPWQGVRGFALFRGAPSSADLVQIAADFGL